MEQIDQGIKKTLISENTNDLGYLPLVFYWIAFYNDGKAFSQFDPDTGKENLFSEIELNNLKVFGWFPFKLKLVDKIKDITVFSKNLPQFLISLENDRKLIACRRNTISYGPFTGLIKKRTIKYILGYQEDNNKFEIEIDNEGNVRVL